MVNAVELPGMTGAKWAPRRTGEYDQDCRVGHALATELMRKIRESENPALFGTVVRAITEGGVYDGVEAGFCSAVGITLLGLNTSVD